VISWEQWLSDDCKKYRLDWQEFLGSESGALGMQVLASKMLTDKRSPTLDSRIIETTAISGAEDNGYRQCYNNIGLLREESVVAIKERKATFAAKAVKQPEGATLPISDEVRERVLSDPIYQQKTDAKQP